MNLPEPCVLGVDFTSAPCKRKPITAARCHLDGTILILSQLEAIEDFAGFENLLVTPGPWIGGFDFPFGLPRDAIDALHWPKAWPDMVRHCGKLGRAAFTAASDGLRRSRPEGKKYPKRRGDDIARAHSPMKCVHPPVGWMFLEGAPRLLNSGVEIPGIHHGDSLRIAVEAYPGLLARALIGQRSYKHDRRALQTSERRAGRALIWSRLTEGNNPLGIEVRARAAFAERILADGSGDLLDAVICAMQAAWAWRRRDHGFGLPCDMDPLEGWIISA